MVGCIGNLYKSVDDLGDTFLQPNLSRDFFFSEGQGGWCLAREGGELGMNEGLRLLKASMQSKMVLTSVFLKSMDT
ncbi:hypothetical protein HN51_029682 [Arachis hypogaea]